MPRVIHTDVSDKIELGDLIEMLETGHFDSQDEDCLASWGPALKKLANNPTFLGDLVIAELKARCATQIRENQYSPQVIMLYSGSSKFALRANFWPAENDSLVRNSGTSPFFYGVAHDHNFSFLTAGYLGPGYWSDYYEYEYGEVHGYVGEPVELKFIEKSRLEPGKVMLYRAHKDVHIQLPAEQSSISVNILGLPGSNEYRDQYRFDVERNCIHGILNRVSIESLVALAAHYGGEAGKDLVENFASHHPSDRVRFMGLKAQAASAGSVGERIALFERAARGSNRYVAEMAKLEAIKVERGRAWIEEGPLQSAS
jgi:hypothetical protein